MSLSGFDSLKKLFIELEDILAKEKWGFRTPSPLAVPVYVFSRNTFPLVFCYCARFCFGNKFFGEISGSQK